jgi:hypothetical protein
LATEQKVTTENLNVLACTPVQVTMKINGTPRTACSFVLEYEHYMVVWRRVRNPGRPKFGNGHIRQVAGAPGIHQFQCQHQSVPDILKVCYRRRRVACVCVQSVEFRPQVCQEFRFQESAQNGRIASFRGHLKLSLVVLLHPPAAHRALDVLKKNSTVVQFL